MPHEKEILNIISYMQQQINNSELSYFKGGCLGKINIGGLYSSNNKMGNLHESNQVQIIWYMKK